MIKNKVPVGVRIHCRFDNGSSPVALTKVHHLLFLKICVKQDTDQKLHLYKVLSLIIDLYVPQIFVC